MLTAGTVRFDHFLTYVEAPSIDEYLNEYRAGGFLVHGETVRHDPGLRNGSVFFGAQYIEFCWVEDEDLFSQGDADEAILRRAHRPCAIGLVSDDVRALHAEWVQRGYEVPEVVSTSERGAADNAPPRWSFQIIPDALLPGAWCFALTYHAGPRPNDAAPNSMYAISGVTLVTTSPESRARAWRDLLAPGDAVNRTDGGYQVAIGPHVALWMDPEEYRRQYGRPWEPAAHRFGELAVLHVLATDLELVRSSLTGFGREAIAFRRKSGDRPSVFIPPDARDGFSFVITEQSV